MPDTVNPYIPGQPVDNPDLFFGRRDILTSIREHLLKGRRVFVVSGAPRMGKSSLLRQVSYHLPEGLAAVRMDLSEETTPNPDRLFWRLADAIGEQANLQVSADDLRPAPEDAHEGAGWPVDKFGPRVRAALGDACLVLMFDDVDYLAQANRALLSSFLDGLERWRDRDADVAIILAMTPALQETLTREHVRLFGGVTTLALGPLASEEATRLITWPVDGVLTYDYGVARRMVEITSGHPYYLQLLCFEVFNRCAAAGWVNQHDLELVSEDLVGREIADFRQLWHESSPQEQAVLAALVSLRGARGVATSQEVGTILDKAGARADPEQISRTLERLTDRGILERLGALSYRFRVALLRDWLSERLNLQEVVRGTRWNDAGAAKAGIGAPVRKLSPSKPRRPRAAARPNKTGEESPEGAEGAPRAFRGWWAGAVVMLGLVLLAVSGFIVFRPSPAEPTPTTGAVFSPTAQRATIEAPATVASLQPVVLGSASATLPPLPTETASPTPPVIVARPVPAIAFQSRESGESRWSVYVMNSDGSDRTRLTDGQSGFLAAPSWSPDGSKIAFVSDREGNPDIWVMDSDGTNLVNLTQHTAKDHSPAWSPDGEWIAFASVRDSLYWELYLMRPDGSGIQRLTWWEDASDLAPTWSPDGTRLAFASKRDGNWEIYSMDREGGSLSRLTNHPADDTNPAWSPDGSRIAFESTRDRYAEIYVMPSAGGEPVNVSKAPFSSEHGPTWSPDGGRIAFYSDRDGEWDIYVMASDGSDVVKLTGDNTNDQVPAWRP
jgi:WD40-like Beta Propeller Repeat/AAA ATPase domain